MKFKKLTLIILITGLLLGAVSGSVFATEKNMEIIIDNAEVYLHPDITSAVIAHLKIGSIVVLASSRQFRKKWNYIYFPDGTSGKMKAGYILESQVSRLFSITTVLSLDLNDAHKQDSSSSELLTYDVSFWRHVFVSLRFF